MTDSKDHRAAGAASVIEPLAKRGVPVIERCEHGWLLAWDFSSRYFDVELNDDGTIDWFWRDRETKEMNGSDAAAGFPKDMAERLEWVMLGHQMPDDHRASRGIVTDAPKAPEKIP